MLAQAGVVHLDGGDAVEREPRQRIARLARESVGPGGRGPDPEQFLRRHLVRHMPMRDTAARVLRQDFVVEVNVALQLRAFPILGDRRVPPLLGERRVVIDAVGVRTAR